MITMIMDENFVIGYQNLQHISRQIQESYQKIMNN